MSPFDLRSLLHDSDPPVPVNPHRAAEVETRARRHQRRVRSAAAVTVAAAVVALAVPALHYADLGATSVPGGAGMSADASAGVTSGVVPGPTDAARIVLGMPSPAGTPIVAPTGATAATDTSRDHLVSRAGPQLTVDHVLEAQDLAGRWRINNVGAGPGSSDDS